MLVVAINNQAKQTRLGKHFPTSSFSWQWLEAGYCHLERSLDLLDSRGLEITIRVDGGDNSGDIEGVVEGGADQRGDLGHLLEVVADMLDNSRNSRDSLVGVGNSRGSRDCVGGNRRSGDNLTAEPAPNVITRGVKDCVCGNRGRGGNNLGGGGGDGVGVDSRGGSDNLGVDDRGGVIRGYRGSSNKRGLLDDRDDSLGEGINKAVLVEVLGESLEGEGLVSLGCGDQVPQGGGEGAGGGALVDVGLGDIGHLGVSSRGSQAGAHDSEEGDLRKDDHHDDLEE